MDKERLVARLLKCIDKDEDSLRIYRLSEPRRRHLEVYGLDHHTDRLLLNRASFDLGIPFVYGAINEWLGQLSLFNPPQTACLACLMPEELQNPEVTPVFGALPGVIGSLQATLALRYLMTGENPVSNALLILRGDTITFETVTFEKRPGCGVCGKTVPSGPRR